jgi:hypothetical protein
MSAAATAAGYLYARGRLAKSDLNGQVDKETSPHTAQSQSSRRLGPKVVLRQGQSQPVKQARTPRIEYRKRRFCLVPSVT